MREFGRTGALRAGFLAGSFAACLFIVGCEASSQAPALVDAASGGSGGNDTSAAGSSGDSGPGGAGGSTVGGAGGSSSPASTGGTTATGTSTGTGGAGGTRDGGAAGSTGSPDAATVDAGAGTCPAYPATAPADAVTAIAILNNIRLAMGIPCAQIDLSLCQSSLNHCNYYAANASNSTCIADPHSEVSTCTGYTGASPMTRMQAAGFTGRAFSECMSFAGDPTRSMNQLINTVYHRTPMLSPWTLLDGYGRATGCDTMDMSTGPTTAATITGFYPYAGQTNVPTSFNGSSEGPTPPTPATGKWPSSSPIHLYLRNATVSNHRIDVDGTDAPLPHTWLQDGVAYVMYADSPFAANTKYRVRIDATQGSTALSFDWTFTTGAR